LNEGDEYSNALKEEIFLVTETERTSETATPCNPAIGNQGQLSFLKNLRRNMSSFIGI
jgi:hypothetical protein